MNTTTKLLSALLLSSSFAVAGCGGDAESIGTDEADLYGLPDLGGITIKPVLHYSWNDSLASNVRMIPVADGLCMLQSAKGRFEGPYAGPRIDQLSYGGKLYYYLGGRSTAPGVSTTAACIRYSSLTGSGLGTPRFTSAYYSTAPHSSTDLTIAGGDAFCALLGFGGDLTDGDGWLGNRAAASWMGMTMQWDRSTQTTWARLSSNTDDPAWAMTECLRLSGRPAGLHQTQFQLYTSSSNWTKLSPESTSICGLSGFEGQLATAADTVEIVQQPDGLYLHIKTDSPSATHTGPLYATANCLSIAQ